jgi:hypothetical protein
MLRILFPFAPTYRRLGLPDRWWHRLTIVLFGVSLALGGAVLAIFVFSEVSPYSITDEVATNLGFQFGNGDYSVDVKDRFTYGFSDWLRQNEDADDLLLFAKRFEVGSFFKCFFRRRRLALDC